MKNLRIYGERPYQAAVVHGGPGAPGSMAPVARELSKVRGILEPLQTKSTLEGQIEELRDVLEKNADFPVVLIGHSWGAWLAYLVAARHPSIVKKLILVGSGAFEPDGGKNITENRLNRLSGKERVEALRLMDIINGAAAGDKNKSLAHLGEILVKADTYEALPLEQEPEPLGVNEEINHKVWAEAEKLRKSGKLLEMGKKIRCPAVALQGDYDSHLGEGVRKPLSRILKDFRFILLEKCGHEPWMERHARDEFFRILRTEVAEG
jgi:pimeloyl-ACP methyl ester carboxylesterase